MNFRVACIRVFVISVFFFFFLVGNKSVLKGRSGGSVLGVTDEGCCAFLFIFFQRTKSPTVKVR